MDNIFDSELRDVMPLKIATAAVPMLVLCNMAVNVWNNISLIVKKQEDGTFLLSSISMTVVPPTHSGPDELLPVIGDIEFE